MPLRTLKALLRLATLLITIRFLSLAFVQAGSPEWNVQRAHEQQTKQAVNTHVLYYKSTRTLVAPATTIQASLPIPVRGYWKSSNFLPYTSLRLQKKHHGKSQTL